jgi:hypothetical protein
MIAFYTPPYTYTQTRVVIIISQTCTNTFDIWPVSYYDHTPVNNFNFTAAPPKNWRWYDIFRTPIQPKALHSTYLQLPALNNFVRIQERYPITQRRYNKRKNYIQKLRA